MNELLIALLGFAGTLLGSLFGILTAQKLTVHRVAQLEAKTEKHDQGLRAVEHDVTALKGRLTEAEHDIRDLKAYHKPT